MRSIHKKTLKRFLSTLLAVVMVLGMVPFTALAAPAPVTLTQSGLEATITPSVPAVTAGNTSTVTYDVTIEATDATANDKVVSLAIGTTGNYTSCGFGVVTINGSTFEITSNQGGFSIIDGKITCKVTRNYAIGSHTVTMSLSVDTLGTNTKTTTITVDQKAALTVTAAPSTVTAGEDFTVTATSDVAEGYVKFTYGTGNQRVAVIPDENGKGIASATFTATGTAGEQTVTALQYAMTGVVNTVATETITVNAATVYRTITFDGNAVDAYHVPAPETVANGANYTVTDAKPNRTGYTFVGWSEDKNATNATYAGTGTETITNVTSDKTLYAVWTKNTVAVKWPEVSVITGIASITDLSGSVLSDTTTNEAEGSTVTFKVTVTDGYDVSNMVVTAGGVALAPVATGSTGVYQYSFVANANTIIYVSPLQPIPVYHSITFLPGAVDAYIPFSPTTVSVKDGESYTLPTAIPTREGYTFKGWDSDGDSDTVEYSYDGSTYTTPTVAPTADMTLNAVWEVEKVAVTLASGTPPTGVTLNSSPEGMKDKGSTVYFTLTVAAGYDPSTMVVTANGVALAAVKSATSSNMYQYSFVADAATEVEVSAPTKYQYTVTLPTGDHFTAKFDSGADSDTVDKVEHGSDSTKFTITPASDWTVDAVYANGEKLTAGADNKYQVINVTANTVVTISMKETVWRTVTYFLDGAGMYAQVQVADGTSPTLLAVPSVKGYTVSGWYTGPDYGTQYTAAAVTKDLSLYAKKEAKTFDITFNMNAGADTTTPASIDKVVKTYGQAAQLRSTVPTRTGYTFLGWGTTADATAASYQPGDMYSADADITLYAVWQIDTFTVTLPNGTGYTAMPASGSSSPVDYNGSFTFTVTVDPGYAVTAPTVKVNDDPALTNPTPTTNADGSQTYTYTISNIQENKVVSIQVAKNPVYTVTFQYTLPGSGTATVYQTQQVEHNAKATQPAPPSVEGYTFEGWYVNLADASAYNFGTPVTADLTLNAKLTAITPKVEWTASGTGWTLSDVKLSGTGTAVDNNSTVAYKSSIEFTVTISTGYDATNLAVAANGLALAPVEVSGNTYKFVLPNITADQKITVTGVARKMITITYNDNGGIGGPGQEQVVYYLSNTDCGEISSVKPTRVGYEFQGWAKANNAAAPAYSNPAKTNPATSKIANFTTDTTLYAVWSAKATTVTLTVDKPSQYEGEDVTLTADVKSGTTAVTSGSVQFYRSNNGATSAELIGTAKVSGGKAVLTIATSAYKRGEVNTDSYTVKFIPDEGSGYSENTSTAVTVNVLSTAISWKLNGENIVTDGNVLTIKDSSNNTVTSMTAGQEYTLELPKIYALDDQTTALVVNKDYKVTWQYCNASGTWTDYTAAAGADSVKILAAYSQYVFRAVVTPLTGATGHFTKAAKYDAGALAADAYEAYLVTEATSPVVRQDTATTLAVSDTHNLTGGTVAEFEGQKVTLTATVTLSGSSTTKVTTGEVYFYKVGSPNTLIGKANVQSDGTAVLEATMSTYSTGASDVFKAVYQENATYETSTSSNESVLIRSTAIAWAKDTSGAEVKTLTVNPTGSIYADNQYTLTLPAIKEEGQDVTLAVGTDYVVSWYMVKADGTEELLAENTQSNTYTVVPPTAGVKFYAVVSPKGNYTDAYENGATKNFLTSDKTDASVEAPTITTITFGDVKTDTGKTPDFSQYEEKTITITAKVVEADFTSTATPLPAKNPEEVVKSGTVTFYVVTTEGTNVSIGTTAVDNSGQATVNYTLPEYALGDTLKNIEYFFAMYTDTVGTYADSNTTDVASSTITDPLTHYFGVGTDTKIDKEAEAVQILSTSISWKLDVTNKIVDNPDANKLKVYNATAEGAKGSLVSDGKMTAGSSYVLELPAVYALDDAKSATPTALTVKKDYKVTWQYREFGTSQWGDYPNTSAGNTVLITPDYSGYQFQAVVTPVYDNDALTGYKTAAAYNASDVATGKTNSLVTDPTEKTERQATTTALTITGADDEAADVVINGATPFNVAPVIGAHWAQFEGQTVTLTATVKETSTNTPTVGKGSVEFYQNGTLIATVPVQTEGADKGKASCTATMTAFTGTDATAKKDTFYAKYVENDSFAGSTSESDSTVAGGYRVVDSGKYYEVVYIKSTTIKTPVIDAKRGTTSEGSTTYTSNLTGLLAGVEHKFTLRTGASTADWSVVALDGRTVASTDYTIQWLVTTGTNEEKAANNETAATFVVNESKNGDKYRVKLVPTADGDMKTGATSNYVVIDSLQNVTVKVTASDEIKSTAATDVYQLNNITLTAEVQGKDSQIMLPTGNVTFYYSVDGNNWVEIGTAALRLDDVSGTKKATFVTDQLPVDIANGYKQEEVTITAVYAGDETFQKSGEFNTTTKEITDTVAGAVTDETVTVYSSVVLVHAAEENKAVTTLADGGIHISANGSLVANETDVALTLQQVYTLDYDIDLSKLVYGTDYTVEWQILENASLYNQSGYYGNTKKWNDIGATGSSYTIGTVPQDAAYRAEITVTNTAPVQGSAQGVLQGAAGDPATGRQVYYSNVLVVGAGQATVTTNITTSDNTNFNEEGIVEGETVTIHALVAGASNVTPISNLTVTILPQGVTDPAQAVFTDELTTVNGYNAFTWNTTGVTPGYYTLTVKAESNNGYAPQTIERTLIVRDNNYKLEATTESKVYNGKAQGIDWTLTGIDIEDVLAQKSVVVYYKQNGKLVEPTQAGTYDYELILPASAYWTEKSVEGTFKIEKRTVDVVDLVAQAKVYDGTTDINELEVILNDSAVDASGVATGSTGIINGDSIYATGVMTIDAAGAGNRTLSVSNVTLGGDDANNYTVGSTNYTESINVQRSQVKGNIANSTFQYTGSNITVPADDIILIDQAGNVITSANYTVTYYYHNGDGVEKVTAMNKLGKYTVIARPEQNNYKGGASETIYVVSGNGTDAAPTAPTSALINITNTVELYGAAGNTGIVATATNGATITTIEYQNGTGWTGTAPTAAGRYLVKVTTDTNDTAYGIYTIVKANPELELTATGATYTSGQITGTPVLTGAPTGAEVYYTYTGGTIQGVSYTAPTEAGDYVVTAHVGETANYTAHEVSANFTIAKAPLKITADDLARWQYGSYPDMVATFTGLATGGVAADTSLRDVQIQPEFIFNDLNGDGQPEYTNSALDQVGKNYPITVRNALARNYTVTYVAGSYAVNELDPKADLAIHGMIDNGTTTENIAYYGDEIQLYAYGNYKSNGDGTGVYNPSSLLKWSLSAGAPATIDQDGLLTITGVGDFTVTLTRGSGDAKISTSIEITALKQEVKVIIPEENKVYSGAEQTYTTANGYAVNGKLANVSSDFNYSNTKRTDVGSQVVSGKVLASDLYYQSETYGGLFTINDKEVTVTPGAQTTVYGSAETYDATKYTEDGIVGGVPALSNAGVASVADAYANLDVLDGYEILVAGTENMNYNVKYITDVTDGSTPDAAVTAKNLTVSTGTLNDNVGMTSGSLNPLGNYPVNGAEVNASATLGASNVRMYGEPNWVMDYALATLISGDSLADLALDPLAGNLVKFNYNIGANANITYPTRTSTPPTYIGSLTAYPVDTDDSMIAFGNYTESYTEGTQNIYQRPVTLALSNGQTTLDIYYSEILMSGGTIDETKLLNIIINNVEAGKYNDGTNYVGGLAELLKHTVKDLDLQVAISGYTAGNPTFTAKVTVGNPNYWLVNAGQKFDITVNILLQRLTVDYTTFTATFSDVVLYQQSETTRVAAYATGDVTFIIYRYVDGQENYSYYAANETAVVSKVMTKDTSRTGRYYVTYPKLSAGTYRVFAVASGYTIID